MPLVNRLTIIVSHYLWLFHGYTMVYTTFSDTTIRKAGMQRVEKAPVLISVALPPPAACDLRFLAKLDCLGQKSHIKDWDHHFIPLSMIYWILVIY